MVPLITLILPFTLLVEEWPHIFLPGFVKYSILPRTKAPETSAMFGPGREGENASPAPAPGLVAARVQLGHVQALLCTVHSVFV